MGKHRKLSDEAIAAFLTSHPGWARSPGGAGLTRTFAFEDYAAGIGFVVRVGFLAEARDHHPEIRVGWRRVEVAWSTHDVADEDLAAVPMGGPERSPQTPLVPMGGPERSPQTPLVPMGGPERSPQTPPGEAAGITALDTALAAETDRLAR